MVSVFSTSGMVIQMNIGMVACCMNVTGVKSGLSLECEGVHGSGLGLGMDHVLGVLT